MFAQIFLVNDAVLADQETHYSRMSVLSGVGQNRKSACHVSVHDVVHGAAFGAVALFREHPEVVSVEGVRLFSRPRIASGLSEVAHLTKRACRLSLCNRPVQAVVLSLIADK